MFAPMLMRHDSWSWKVVIVEGIENWELRVELEGIYSWQMKNESYANRCPVHLWEYRYVMMGNYCHWIQREFRLCNLCEICVTRTRVMAYGYGWLTPNWFDPLALRKLYSVWSSTTSSQIETRDSLRSFYLFSKQVPLFFPSLIYFRIIRSAFHLSIWVTFPNYIDHLFLRNF